jgi:LAO/AO transport system kinase
MLNLSAEQIINKDIKAISRAISLISNNNETITELIKSLRTRNTPVIGVTGPPGAGKSTLTDRLIGELLKKEKNIAVLCIDPSSPFTKGAILGDRIRMSQWYNHPNVFIRSLASRGAMGGLTSQIKEIIQLLKSSAFDYIIVETVGVGQNEIEIASLADLVLLVLVPESGDSIQLMKAGLLEIGDLLVVNKSDRPGSGAFAREIEHMLRNSGFVTHKRRGLFKTIASTNEGVPALAEAIEKYLVVIPPPTVTDVSND